MNYQILNEDVQHFAEQFELWEKLRNKTFLITGVTGLIGSVLTKCLLALNQRHQLGIKIVVVVRNIEKARTIFADDFEKIEFLQIQLTDICEVSTNTPIDYIVHLASVTSGKYMERYPVETYNFAYLSTLNLLELAKRINVEGFVYVSSLEYYGQILDDILITEDIQGYVNPVSVRSSYPMGKRAAEYLCYAYSNEYGISAKVARLTQTFGAGISSEENRVFAQFAKSVIKGEDIILHTSGDSAKPYCYTIDSITAILYILLRGEKGEAYNVANENTYISIRDMAELVRKNFNTNINVRIELNENMGYAPVTKLNLSSKKLQSLGWYPQYGLVEMYRKIIDYLQ